MTKKFVIVSLSAFAAINSFAGGLLTNTNQSVHFLRNPARDASTEIDAVYTNPAGLTFLSDGFHLSLNNQSAFQTRTITSTFAGFKLADGNNGSDTKIFKGEASAPIIPSFQLAYKKDKMVFSAAFAVTGGGGKATFNQGLPSFESGVSLLPSSLTLNNVLTNRYSVDSYMEGKQFIFGIQMNASYKINDNLSAAFGGRLNIINSQYAGYIRNIMINPTHPVINPTGAMIKATDFFNSAAALATGTATSMAGIESQGYGAVTLNQLVSAGKMNSNQLAQLAAGLNINTSEAGEMTVTSVKNRYTTVAATNVERSAKVADKELDCTQTGWGVTPILSLNYHLENLNLAAKYEFMTALNIQNDTKVNTTGVAAYDDGVNTPNDIPALLTIGGDYKLCSKLSVSAGYHHFFDSDAKMANNKQQYINGGVNEYLLGTEYKINDRFLVSAGGQITRTGVTDDYQSDMSFSLNSYSIGFGGAMNITSNLRLNIAYFFTQYSDWTKKSDNYNNLNTTGDKSKNIPGTDVYGRTNKVFGIGLDYKF